MMNPFSRFWKPPITTRGTFQGRPSLERAELVSFPLRPGVPIDSFAFHDTAGQSQKRMIENSLHKHKTRGSKTGVTFSMSLDRPGKKAPEIIQHHALDRYSNHCCKQNRRMHGIEVVNLFDPVKHKTPASPHQEIIAAPWFRGGRVISPTPAQLELGFRLVRWLVKEGLCVKAFPAIMGREFVWQTLPMYRKTGTQFEPGIYAHAHLNAQRADGYLQTVYTWLRFHGYSAKEAYLEMKRQSASVRTSTITRYKSSVLPKPKSGKTKLLVAGGVALAALAAGALG